MRLHKKSVYFIGNGFDGREVKAVIDALKQNQVFYDIISEKLGPVNGADGTVLKANKTFIVTAPPMYDSLYIVGGNAENQAKFDHDIMHFVNMAYNHFKPIGIATTGQPYFQTSETHLGVVFAKDNPGFVNDFITAIGQQRFWGRPPTMISMGVEAMVT